ncbi:hypothetical protein WKT22_01057 [Candidatus Lokiarchaeum ossiferum]
MEQAFIKTTSDFRVYLNLNFIAFIFLTEILVYSLGIFFILTETESILWILSLPLLIFGVYKTRLLILILRTIFNHKKYLKILEMNVIGNTFP